MHLCQEAVVIVEPAGQRLGQFCSAGLQQAMTNPASTSGSRSPAISASIIRRPDAPLRGKIIDSATVSRLQDIGSAVVVSTAEGSVEQFDVAVVATGAWLGELARPFGVRNVVQAGRGYSFSVAIDQVPDSPLYFPAQRIACTPIGDRLRIAGMMEFRKPEAPLDHRRVQAIADAARPLLHGIDIANRQDEWVGSRPCTVDGLPLIGATGSPRVYVAGGHGMWGITHGPVTGRLLAEMMVTGKLPEHITPFDPLRRS